MVERHRQRDAGEGGHTSETPCLIEEARRCGTLAFFESSGSWTTGSVAPVVCSAKPPGASSAIPGVGRTDSGAGKSAVPPWPVQRSAGTPSGRRPAGPGRSAWGGRFAAPAIRDGASHRSRASAITGPARRVAPAGAGTPASPSTRAPGLCGSDAVVRSQRRSAGPRHRRQL